MRHLAYLKLIRCTSMSSIVFFSWLLLVVVTVTSGMGMSKPCEPDDPEKPLRCPFSMKCLNDTKTEMCDCEKGSRWDPELEMCLLKEGDFCFRDRICASGICEHNNCYSSHQVLEDPRIWYIFFVLYNGLIIVIWLLCRLRFWCKRRKYTTPPRQGYFEYEMRQIDEEYRQAILDDEKLYSIEYDLSPEFRHPGKPKPISWF